MNAAPVASEDGDVLTFKVGGEALSLAASEVSEIIRPRALTRVPHAPAALLGVTNLRGAVLPVVSLAGLMGHDVVSAAPSSRIVVAGTEDLVGLLVDEVSALTKPTSERRLDLTGLLALGFGGSRRKIRGSAAPRSHAVPAQTAADEDILVMVGFALAGQDYAMPLDTVVEVKALPESVSSVPGTDQAMIGVTDLRGSLLPLVSLNFLLGLPAGVTDRKNRRVVVTRIGSARVGLVVDEMRAILRVPRDAIDPVPPVLTRGKGEARIEAICRLEGGRKLVAVLAPARLFDDQTAERILAEAERGAAEMSGVMTAGGTTEQFVVFRLGEELYGLPILAVDEIVRRPDQLTRVPRAPAFVEGVMNLRGKVIPVISQRRRFSVPGETGGQSGRVIVVTIGRLQAGFAVDAVSEIIAVRTDDLKTPPDLTAEGEPVFDRIATIESDGRMILLIDPRALLDRAERDILVALATETARAP